MIALVASIVCIVALAILLGRAVNELLNGPSEWIG